MIATACGEATRAARQASDRFFDRLSPAGRDALPARWGTRLPQHEPGARVAVWNLVLQGG